MTNPEYERWAELADRQAIGEILTDSEHRFLESFAATDPLALAEETLLGSLSTLEPFADELGNRALADAAVRRVTEARREGVRRSRMLWLGAGALAAAAAIAVLIRKPASVEPVAQAESVVEYVAPAAAARTAAGALLQGARVTGGTEIEAIGGPVCVAVEPKIHACLASGSKIRLSQIGVAARRVDLVTGRVAVALFPLPRGERFSVVTGGVWSTAVGTAFTVERLANGTVETIVHEGKVAVGPEHGGELVTAHKIGLSHGGGTAIASLEAHGRTETPEWAALASVAHRAIEAEPVPSKAPEAPVAEATGEPVQPTEPKGASTPSRGVTSAPSRSKAEPAPVVTTTAPELLASARRALREQRWSDAADAYARIVSDFPSSPEAHTVLVPLARVELERVGRPGAALEHVKAYLAVGGSLDVEAELLRIRAYRALGKSEDEARSIDAFLAAHPNNLEAEQLRTRRAALGVH